ncbi:MAG: sodium:solute symporter family protein [Gammaproteobacteria bacterium]|jgi:sodium/pantothenate symporter|nr:sodium:solute symporter family protein [Gammaproteobacteria bacterium]
MDVYTTTIAISILVYIAIGNYAGRGIKNLDDYYVAGRRAPTLLIVGTLVASLMSSTMFLGEAGFAYDTQAGPYVLFPQAAAIGYVLGALFFGRYLRRSRTNTLAEFFGQRFNSKRVQTLAGVTIVLALGGYLLAVTQGAAILLSELTDLTYVQGLVVAWLSYTLFTMYSGSRGVILTDTIMFLLFTIASAAAIVFLVQELGGVPNIVEEIVGIEEKKDLLSWHGMIGPGTEWPTPMDYLIWAIVIDVSWMLVYMVSPWQSSRHQMARNEHVVLRAATIAALFVVLLQVMVYGMGGVINIGNPAIIPPESATIWASLHMLPKMLGALMLAGIMAAVLSSASTFLSLVGFSVSNDIGIHQRGDEAKTLRFSRIMMLVVGALALAAALIFPPQIFWLTTFIATIFASSWGPVGLMAIWSKRITEKAAFWGMLTGLVFNVVPKFFEFIGMLELPSYLNPVIIGGVLSLVVTVVVSRVTSRSEEEVSYLEKLHVRPVDEVGPKRTRVTLFAPAVLLVINGLLLPVVLTIYYVLPYQRATGTLSPDGSLDWATGEMALMASWSIIWISVAVFAIRYIRRAYSPVKT